MPSESRYDMALSWVGEVVPTLRLAYGTRLTSCTGTHGLCSPMRLFHFLLIAPGDDRVFFALVG
jgi:hypothetical protein